MNNSLDKLRNIEVDILNIGDKISDLFEEIDSIYKGKHFEIGRASCRERV